MLLAGREAEKLFYKEPIPSGSNDLDLECRINNTIHAGVVEHKGPLM